MPHDTPNPTELTAIEQVKLLENRSLSARELLDAHLERIEQLNPDYNAVVALNPDVAAGRAKAVDDARAADEPVGPLAGLVTAHKDLTETADFVTTHGSPLLASWYPAKDSQLVQRITAAGAVAVGKTNVPEFGAGSHTINPVYGPTRNPWNPALSAGGSSGGAAVALATGMVSIADGSDMGGSLRNPASWNSVVGFRNTPRVVPTVTPGNAWLGLGVGGAMGRTVDDLALLLGVIGQPDARDPMSRSMDWPQGECAVPSDPPRAAWSPTLGGLPVDPEVATTVRRAVDTLADAGWEIEEAEPSFTGADECFETLRSWYFAFLLPPIVTDDAIADGHIKTTVVDEVNRGRALQVDAVMAAHVALSRQWVRSVEFFRSYDVLLAPVSQLSPFPIEWEYPSEVAGVQMERYLTWMRSACRVTTMGSPALSVPAGLDSNGMPVGLQMVGAPGDDVAMLGWAKAAERLLAAPRWSPDVRSGAQL